MWGDRRVTVLIPALDEQGNIGRVVRALPRDLVDEVVVVDNGSTDGTAPEAREAGAVVVHAGCPMKLASTPPRSSGVR